MNDLEKRRQQISSILLRKGYPAEFAFALCDILKTEKAMKRMVGYLLSIDQARPEDIADEAIAIVEEHARWRQKKINEYNNACHNILLNSENDENR